MNLLELAKSGDKSAKQELVTQNSGLVWSVVKRFYGRGHEPEDLFQVGCIGLLKAIQRFEPELNNCFSTYAFSLIIGEIKKFIRDDGSIKVSRLLKELASKIGYAKNSLLKKLNREPYIQEIADFLNTSVENINMAMESSMPTKYISEDIDSYSNCTSSEESSDFESQILDEMIFSQAMQSLDSEEQQLVNLRCQRGMTQIQVARVMKKTQVQISRLEKKIFSKLTEMQQSSETCNL